MSNSDASEAPAATEPERPIRPLSRWERFWAATAGTLVTAAGSTAVFMSKTEAGPAVMVAIGAVLIVMAITGSPITRAKFGDNEVNLAARREALDALQKAEPDQVEPALAVMEAYDPASAASSRVHGWEILVESARFRDRIRDVLRKSYGEGIAEDIRSNGRRLDFMVERENCSIAVDLFYSTSTSRFLEERFQNHHTDKLMAGRLSRALIVSSVPVDERLRRNEIERAAVFGTRLDIVSTDVSVTQTEKLIAAIEALAAEKPLDPPPSLF